MNLFLVTFVVFLGIIALMSIGLLMGKRLKGSCGGLGQVMGDKCMFCEKKDECKNKNEEVTRLS